MNQTFCLIDHLPGNPTVTAIRSLVDVSSEATTIDLRFNDLGAWSVEQITALKGVFLKRQRFT